MMSSPSLPSLRLLAASLAIAALQAPTVAQTICLTAEIEGAQEVPVNASPAKGTACFLVDTVINAVTYELTFEGLPTAETSAHIHGYAPPGSNAPLLFVLPPGLHKSGVWFYAEADEAKLLSGLAYVNIHSAAFPNGEIRGQMVRDVSNATMVARIDGPQVPTGSPALGTGCFSVDTVTNAIDYQITFTSSTLLGPETVSHVHGFALPGVNAGIKFALPLGFHKKGTWFYPESDEAGILAGLTYVNIHSNVFPGGEIRGQVLVACKCEPGFTSYCTAGTSASGCMAMLFATGIPSATLPSGFTVSATGVEAQKDALFFFGTNGRQANPWGNGTSFQCVSPPVKRAGLLNGGGTAGLCDGTFDQDLNARWTAKPPQNPGAGATVQTQLWYRDPMNTSNQTTSLSNALEFVVCP